MFRSKFRKIFQNIQQSNCVAMRKLSQKTHLLPDEPEDGQPARAPIVPLVADSPTLRLDKWRYSYCCSVLSCLHRVAIDGVASIVGSSCSSPLYRRRCWPSECDCSNRSVLVIRCPTIRHRTRPKTLAIDRPRKRK